MLKFVSTLFNLANICPHISPGAEFHLFLRSDEKFFWNVREHFVGGPSIVFTRKNIVEKTRICMFTNALQFHCFNSHFGQIHLYSVFQPTLEQLYTRHEVHAELQSFEPPQNKFKSFSTLVMLCFQQRRLVYKNESLSLKVIQKKIVYFNVDGFWKHCKTLFEAKRCFLLLLFLSKKTVRAPGAEDSQHENEKRKWRKCRKSLWNQCQTVLEI